MADAAVPETAGEIRAGSIPVILTGKYGDPADGSLFSFQGICE